MALTIPYPDMDFVPLDVLTADELDQMVANIEYIANAVPTFPIGSQDISDSAVTTAKINDSAITSDKIDFTTLPKYYSMITGYDNIGTTEVTVGTINVAEAGTYLILAQCQVNLLNHSVGNAYVTLKQNGTSIAGTECYFSGDSGWFNFPYASVNCVADLTANTTVTLRAKTGQSTMSITARRGYIIAIKI